VKSAEDQDSGAQGTSKRPGITSTESTTALLEDSRLCAIKRESVLYLLCVISIRVQINSLVKSRESTFIVATCNKHVTVLWPT
jgi:hypothetical protein